MLVVIIDVELGGFGFCSALSMLTTSAGREEPIKTLSLGS